jgi:type III secretory pathway component EscV
VLVLAKLNETSSLTSAIALSSSSTSTGSSVTTLVPATIGTTSTPTSTGAVTTNAAGAGLTQGNKISLGVGIGIGIPSLLVAILSAWLVYIGRKRRGAKSTRQHEKGKAAEEMEATTNNSSERVEGHESKIQRVSVNMCLTVHRDVVREFNIRQLEDHPTEADQEIGVTLTRQSGGEV